MKLLAFSFALLCAAPVCAQPAYYRVTGVAADDTLNVRAEPDANSADIGDLAPNATAVEVLGTDASGDWGEIIWEEGNGWVAMRFLAPDSLPTVQGTSLPAGLQCGGTEPFWTLKLSQNSAVFSDISGTVLNLSLAASSVAEGRPAYPVAMQHGASGSNALSVILPVRCGDGMSDRDYPFTHTLLLQTQGGRRFLEGCCYLPPDSGTN